MEGVTTVPVMWDPALTQRGLSREQYEVLVGAGLLDDNPVELLEGTLVEMTPQGAYHSLAVTLLSEALRTRLSARRPGAFLVPTHSPLAVSGASEPEPDIAVIDALRFTDAKQGHPATAHLVVEVAQTSQRADLLHKPRIYAGAGIPSYWVFDLESRRVVVHGDPTSGADPIYSRVREQTWETPLSVLDVTIVPAAV